MIWQPETIFSKIENGFQSNITQIHFILFLKIVFFLLWCSFMITNSLNLRSTEYAIAIMAFERFVSGWIRKKSYAIVYTYPSRLQETCSHASTKINVVAVASDWQLALAPAEPFRVIAQCCMRPSLFICMTLFLGDAWCNYGWNLQVRYVHVIRFLHPETCGDLWKLLLAYTNI